MGDQKITLTPPIQIFGEICEKVVFWKYLENGALESKTDEILAPWTRQVTSLLFVYVPKGALIPTPNSEVLKLIFFVNNSKMVCRSIKIICFGTLDTQWQTEWSSTQLLMLRSLSTKKNITAKEN